MRPRTRHCCLSSQERDRAGVVEWSRNQAVRHAQVRPPASAPPFRLCFFPAACTRRFATSVSAVAGACAALLRAAPTHPASCQHGSGARLLACAAAAASSRATRPPGPTAPLLQPQLHRAIANESEAAIEQFGAIASLHSLGAPPPSPRSLAAGGLPLAARPDLRPDMGQAVAVVDRLRRRKVAIDEGEGGKQRMGGAEDGDRRG